MIKTKYIAGIQVIGVSQFAIEKRVFGQSHRFEKRTYLISLIDKEKAYRRIDRLSKLIAADIQKKWKHYTKTGKELFE